MESVQSVVPQSSIASADSAVPAPSKFVFDPHSPPLRHADPSGTMTAAMTPADDATTASRPGRRKQARAKVPYAHVYPDTNIALTLDHMALMRDLASAREMNRETAFYSLLDIAFGMNALQACLDGEVVPKNPRHDTRRSLEVRVATLLRPPPAAWH